MESPNGLRSFAWSAVPGRKQETIHLVGHDTTARKQAETDLALARDQAEAANRAKTEFLGEYERPDPTPMNADHGADRAGGSTGPLDPEQRDYLTVVKRSGEALLDLLDDILDLRTFESSPRAAPGAFRLARHRGGRRARAGRAGVGQRPSSSTCRIIPRRRGCCRETNALLRQILMNLLGNAIKFTDRGEVGVEASGDPGCRTLSYVIPESALPRTSWSRCSRRSCKRMRPPCDASGGPGARACHLEPPGEDDGRPHWGREQAGRRQHVPRSATSGPRRGESAIAADGTLSGQRVLIADDNATVRRARREDGERLAHARLVANSGDAAWRLLQQAWQEEDPFAFALLDARYAGRFSGLMRRGASAIPMWPPGIVLLGDAGQRPGERGAGIGRDAAEASAAQRAVGSAARRCRRRRGCGQAVLHVGVGRGGGSSAAAAGR